MSARRISSSRRRLALAALLVLALPAVAAAQDALPPAPVAAAPVAPPERDDSSPADPIGAVAEGLEGELLELAPPIRLVLLLSLLVFLPSLLLTVTCYTRIIIVLSFIRRAIGTTELPPNPVLTGIALFLTAGVMAPTFGRVMDRAITPLLDERIDTREALANTADELKTFMLSQTREDDLLFALELSHGERGADAASTPFSAVVPAFVLSELRTAFRMGFLIFLPFVLIDLVVSSILLSLGMFMLPPTILATPLKLLLFVLVDGWTLVVRSLSLSFLPAA